MAEAKMSGRQILQHFASRLQLLEASLPSILEVKSQSQAPSDVAELDRIRNSYEGEPAVLPATWAPRWTDVLGTSSVLEGLQRLLSGIVQVDVFQLQYGAYKDEECQEALQGDEVDVPSTSSCILRLDGERCGANLFNYNISTCAGLSSDSNNMRIRNSDSLVGKTLNVSLSNTNNMPEEGISVPRLYHPIPCSSSEISDFGDFVSELHSRLCAQAERLLYLTWRGLPALEKLDSYSAPTEFQFFLRNLFHPTTSPEFITEDTIVQRNLWVGAMVTSRIHFDAMDNIHVCLSGKKLFHLYPPSALPYLYPKLWREGALNNFSSMETIFLANPVTHADFFLNVKCWRAEVEPGEAILIPAGWWHEVFTFQETVSANIWFKPNPVTRFRPTLMHAKSEKYYNFMLQRMGRGCNG
eukprot:Gb_02948 [translate_table: standard]